jgi:outer membrane protein OmpA-like peptidoglycan-associated protein
MLTADDIVDLGAALKRAGFKVSTNQLLFAQRIASECNGGPGDPTTLLRLSNLLAPIFCTTPLDQERFGLLYLKWLRDRFNSHEVLPPPPPPPPPKWPYLLLAMSSIMICLVVWYVWQENRPRQMMGVTLLHGKPLSDVSVQFDGDMAKSAPDGHFMLPFRAGHAPGTMVIKFADGRELSPTVGSDFAASRRRLYFDGIGMQDRLDLGSFEAGTVPYQQPPIVIANPTTTSEFVLTPQERFIVGDVFPEPSLWERLLPLNAVLSLLPLAMCGAYLLYRYMRRPVLKGMASRSTHVFQQIYLSGGGCTLFPSVSMRRLAQTLRTRKSIESSVLDIERTVLASAERGGVFTPVCRFSVEPGYVALVDRCSFGDHQAFCAGQIITDVIQSDVLIEQFDFSGDPSFLRVREPGRAGRKGTQRTRAVATIRTITLEELASRYPGRRLLMFAEPETLFDGFTGRLQEAGEQFSQWEERYLFTPKDAWGPAERALDKTGFRILSFSPEGLHRFSELVQQGSKGHDQVKMGAREKALYDRRPARWLERHAPPDDVIRQLCDELTSHLGIPAFTWLCACAAYPEIIAGLTLRLGKEILGPSRVFEQALPCIARLIWFREAFMPDWLREALLKHLTKELQSRIRTILTDILSSAGEQRSPLSLRIAVDKPTVKRGLAEKIQVWIERRQSQRRVKNLIAEAPMKSPLRDAVFLQFLSGRRDILTPWVPNNLLRVFFPHGQVWLGTKPSILGAIAMLVTAVVIFVMPPIAPVKPGMASGLSFSASSGQLSTLVNGRVVVWDLAGKAGSRRVLPATIKYANLAFNPADNALLGASKADGADGINFYNVLTEDEVTSLNVPGTGPFEFSNDGSRLATIGRGGVTEIWDLKKQQLIKQIHSVMSQRAFSPDGKRLAVVPEGQRETVLLYEVSNDSPLFTLKFSRNVTSLSFASDSNTLAVGDSGGLITLYDFASGNEITRFDNKLKEPIHHLTFHPDGTVLAAANDTQLILWDVIDREPLMTTSTTPIRTLAFSPDGKSLGAVSNDGAIQVWSVPPHAASTLSRSIGLVVGESFPGSSFADSSMVKKAQSVSNALTELGFQVFRLEEPSRDQILESLRALTDQLRPADRLIIYLSGGGGMSDKDFFFPTLLSAPTQMAVTGKDFIRFLQSCRANEVLLAIDSRYSQLISGEVVIPSEWSYPSGRTRMLLSPYPIDLAYPDRGLPLADFGDAFTDALRNIKMPMRGAAFAEDVRRRMSRISKSPDILSYKPIRAGGHTGGDFEFIFSGKVSDATHDSTGYAFYGEMSGKNFFKRVDGEATAEPKAGDMVEATAAVNVRSGYSDYDKTRGWVKKEIIGLLRPNDRVKVIATKTVARFIWIQFERLPSSTSTRTGPNDASPRAQTTPVSSNTTPSADTFERRRTRIDSGKARTSEQLLLKQQPQQSPANDSLQQGTQQIDSQSLDQEQHPQVPELQTNQQTMRQNARQSLDQDERLQEGTANNRTQQMMDEAAKRPIEQKPQRSGNDAGRQSTMQSSNQTKEPEQRAQQRSEYDVGQQAPVQNQNDRVEREQRPPYVPENNPSPRMQTRPEGISDIFFQTNSWQLSNETQKVMDDVVVYLKSSSDDIVLEGHASEAEGDSEESRLLSEKRAQIVAEYFLKKGVSFLRISTVGYGTERPFCKGTPLSDMGGPMLSMVSLADHTVWHSARTVSSREDNRNSPCLQQNQRVHFVLRPWSKPSSAQP